ncbi:MAG: adenylate kinase [Candidatus Bathyarchaeia archaeon]
MRLIIFGPPGSGKGTYAFRIMQPLGIAKISTGDIFREERDKGTSLGKYADQFMRRGELVPDDVVIDVLKRRLQEPDAERGFVLDGYPRTVRQAEALDEMTKIDAVINLIIPEEILVEKLAARRTCQNCGDLYNVADINRKVEGVTYVLPPMLPKKPGICDKCGGKLVQREDDRPEVIRERLGVYERQSKPVVAHYKGKVPFIDIHVNRPPDEVTRRILRELAKLGRM